MPSGFQHRQEFADLTVHVSDFAEVSRKRFSRHLRIGDVGWQLDIGGWIRRRVAHYPWDVRFHESNNEAERLIFVAAHELFRLADIMCHRRITNAVWVVPTDGLKWERFVRFDMHFTSDADTITELPK